MAKVSFGEFYFDELNTALTTLAAATPAKAAGATLSNNLAEWTMPVNNRLTYGGSDTRTFCVSASISAIKAGGAAAEARFYIYKNGALLPGAVTVRDVTNNTGALPIQEMASMATNDYFEIYLETDSGDDVTVVSGGLMVWVAG